MISLDQLGILRQDLLKPDACHILMPFSAHGKGIIIFLDAFIDRFQFILVRLKPFNIFRGQIPVLLNILADDPLTQCSNYFSGLKIHKTKKVSCTDISLIIGKTLLQTADCSGQVTDAGFLQTLVVIKL